MNQRRMITVNLKDQDMIIVDGNQPDGYPVPPLMHRIKLSKKKKTTLRGSFSVQSVDAVKKRGGFHQEMDCG